MSPEIQWALIVLGVLGASGTWFRSWVAYRAEKRASRVNPWWSR